MIALLLTVIPPPLPPIATLEGGQTLCHSGYAIVLTRAEAAEQVDADNWSVFRPGFSVDLRPFSAAELASARAHARGNQRPRAASVPGRPGAFRFRYTRLDRYPHRGWAWALPGGADYVLVMSYDFTGRSADHATLRRVLTGEARARLCPAPPRESAP